LAPAALLLGPGQAWSAEGSGGEIDHVESREGRVDLLFSVPDSGGAPDLDSVQVSVDGKPVRAEASSASEDSGTIRRTAVLAIDVSKSMTGAPFAQAQRAALTFLDIAPSDVRVGVVTFADEVATVHQPTTDRGVLSDSIDTLSLSARTSLYGGVLEAVEAAGPTGLRNILVLSDGRDTTDTALAEVTAAVGASRARVDVVALGQAGSARTALEQIATAGHGSVIDASEPEALDRVFADEAAALGRQILVSFPVPRDASGADASVSVQASADGTDYSDTAVVGLSQVEPEEPAGPIAATESRLSVGVPAMLAGIGVFGLGLFVLLLLAFGVLNRPVKDTVERKLQAYGLSPQVTVDVPAPTTGGVKKAAVGVAEKALGNGRLSAALARKLDAAGIPLTAPEWVLLHLGISLGAAFVGIAMGGGAPLLVVLFLLLGAALPWGYVVFKRSRRLKQFQAQLAPTLQVMSGSLSAGLSLAQSVETVVREGAEPIAGEFRRALIEQRLGVEIENALEGVAERMDSKDFAWMVMAVRIQRDVGGNLAELLDTVAGTLRERQYLRRQVTTLSAEGRLSAWIIGGLPPLFVAYLALVQPDYLSPMLHSPLGWALLGTAALMMTIGAVWLKHVVKIEV
jgi:tight adherence protein B